MTAYKSLINRGWTPEKSAGLREEARKLRRQGYSYDKISIILNIGKQTAYKYCQRKMTKSWWDLQSGLDLTKEFNNSKNQSTNCCN